MQSSNKGAMSSLPLDFVYERMDMGWRDRSVGNSSAGNMICLVDCACWNLNERKQMINLRPNGPKLCKMPREKRD